MEYEGARYQSVGLMPLVVLAFWCRCMLEWYHPGMYPSLLKVDWWDFLMIVLLLLYLGLVRYHRRKAERAKQEKMGCQTKSEQ